MGAVCEEWIHKCCKAQSVCCMKLKKNGFVKSSTSSTFLLFRALELHVVNIIDGCEANVNQTYGHQGTCWGTVSVQGLNYAILSVHR